MSNSWPPILAVPEGKMTFCTLTALMTSAGRKPARLEFLAVNIDRDHSLLAAVRVGDRRAGNRHQLNPEEVQRKIVELLLRKLAPLNPRRRTGTLEALKLKISGGVSPGGSCFKTAWEAAVNCAIATGTLAFGWR